MQLRDNGTATIIRTLRANGCGTTYGELVVEAAEIRLQYQLDQEL